MINRIVSMLHFVSYLDERFFFDTCSHVSGVKIRQAARFDLFRVYLDATQYPGHT